MTRRAFVECRRSIAIGTNLRPCVYYHRDLESDLPGSEFVAWFGGLAPKGTPRPIIEEINRKIREVLAKPTYAKRFDGHRLEIIASSPVAYASHLRSERAMWGKVKERHMHAD